LKDDASPALSSAPGCRVVVASARHLSRWF